ncbi:MAG: MgtC/SapB family protein [Myxococcales bacterium]
MHDWWTLISRLLLALMAGGAIGLNRGMAGKPAGTRTHMLISLGAALYVMSAGHQHPGSDAESRAIQGVAAGVGFLGAGEIVHRTKQGKPVPHNLTSAAAIWVAASAGVAAGVGLWELLVTATALTLFALIVIKKIEGRFESSTDSAPQDD